MKRQSSNSNELFFIVSPPDTIAQHIWSLKKRVRKIIGHTYESEFSKAHISLFKDRGNHVERRLYPVDDVVSVFNPFHVHLKNFASFKNGDKRTIYLDIVHKNPFRDLSENLTGKESFTPHITIAKNLKMDDFTKVWEDFQSISYSEYFQCDRITVLKRSTYKWMPHINIPLARPALHR